ncbi:hypothetical protein [Legionella londiniensis]|uniref:Uncharacterized protein n=1 Tax=Legionella londiniensis TaxID=45068 RepID=A0A0W0VLW5_9GAMM|nr:hypothetical protein [Legionella londiniensis]KTD21111.1 hypothetical protein Llon_1209 [Legionella londiniensis]STX93133.1 Uncharacterised protein [Legionella londiniensis]
MRSERKLSDYTDMNPKDFVMALRRVDWKAWRENPDEALKKAGVRLNPGICFKIVKNQKEADNLPENELPLMLEQKQGKKLNLDELSCVAGGDALRTIFTPLAQLLSKIPGWQVQGK